jgi:hypothetical protein
MKRFLSIIVVLAAACGGSDKSSTATTTPGDHKKDHPKLTPELEKFHDTLSPRWHAAAGPERMKDTCAAVSDFEADATAVKAAAAPAGVEEATWLEAGGKLEASVAQLKVVCGGTDQPAFDTAFGAVHDAFHEAMELVVGKHEMGDGGEHGEHH